MLIEGSVQLHQVRVIALEQGSDFLQMAVNNGLHRLGKFDMTVTDGGFHSDETFSHAMRLATMTSHDIVG